MSAGFEVSHETYPSTKTASLRVLVHFGRVIRSADDPPSTGSTDVYRHERAQALKIERYFWLDPYSPFIEFRWTGSDTIEDWFGFHADLQGISHDGLAFLELARGFIADPRKTKPVEIARVVEVAGIPLLNRQGLGPNKFSLESLVVDEGYHPGYAEPLIDVFTPFDRSEEFRNRMGLKRTKPLSEEAFNEHFKRMGLDPNAKGPDFKRPAAGPAR